MAEVALAAQVRPVQGSSESRRLRAAGKIPGVLYGHGIEPVPLLVEARALRQALNTDAGLNALIQLELEGKRHLALPRDVQRHPVRHTVAHVDFQVVRRDEVMSVDVPLQFLGEADGVVKAGGIVEHHLQTLAVEAKPGDIPTHLEIDISELQLEQQIRVKDVPLPAGVTTLLDPEEIVVVGATTRHAVAAANEAAEEAGTTEPAPGDQ